MTKHAHIVQLNSARSGQRTPSSSPEYGYARQYAQRYPQQTPQQSKRQSTAASLGAKNAEAYSRARFSSVKQQKVPSSFSPAKYTTSSALIDAPYGSSAGFGRTNARAPHGSYMRQGSAFMPTSEGRNPATSQGAGYPTYTPQQPRAAVTTGVEEDAEEKLSRKEVRRKKNAKRKADRVFGKEDAQGMMASRGSRGGRGQRGAQDSGQSGSKAALYKMEMGATHRKTSRSQSGHSGRGGNSGGFFGFGIPAIVAPAFVWTGILAKKWARVALGFMSVLIVCAVMLYGPISAYYQEVRNNQLLNAQYALVLASNQNMKDQIDYLATKEGLEEYAHNELGWIRSDEHAVRVTGLEKAYYSEGHEKERVVSLVRESNVEVPTTWYSPFLDPIFGFNK